ncbi:helix-turn-helix transcriptional regulator [bacterium]|nr:helix-turn-helix transcriptional regulator [bacterium]
MNETIGSRICGYRKAKGMTQEELASRLGVSAQAVSKWENDGSCPDISLVPQLCRELGVTADELLAGRTSEVKLVPAEQRRGLEQLTLRVYINTADGDRVKVNLPMPLVKTAMELGVDMTAGIGSGDAVKNLDLGKILEFVEQGAIGKLVEVETGDGDLVEVVVE